MLTSQLSGVLLFSVYVLTLGVRGRSTHCVALAVLDHFVDQDGLKLSRGGEKGEE